MVENMVEECIKKYKPKLFYRIYAWSICIISCQFVGLYNLIDNTTQIYYTDMISILTILLNFLVLIIGLHGKITFNKNLQITKCMAYLFTLLICLMIVSFIKYHSNENLVDIYKEVMHYFASITTFFTLYGLTKRKEDGEYLIGVIIKVSLLCSVMSLICFLLWEYKDINLIGLNVDSYSFTSRGSARFNIGMMVYVPGILFAISHILAKNKKHKVIDYLTIILGLIHVIVISKTRSLSVWIIISVILCLLRYSKKQQIGVIFSVVVISYGLIMLGSTKSLVDDLFADNSFSYRLQAITYYLDQVMRHPVFGMGYIGASNEALSVLLYGPLHRFYRVDVGVIGFINEGGIVTTIWLIYFYIKSYTIIKNNKKQSNLYYYVLLMFWFILMSSVNLFFLNPGLIFEFTIFSYLLAVLEKFRITDEQNKKEIESNSKTSSKIEKSFI